jgi:hypothetical protein
MAPVALLAAVGLWITPPVALAVSLTGGGGEGLLTWALTVYAVSALTFTVFTHRMGGPGAYGLLYPLGGLVGTYILVRSWTRGRTVEWKGRRYTVPAASERA